MNNKSLYIHIGCHKTGTTSIQHTLAMNEDILNNKGLTFFYRNFNTDQNEVPDLHSWLRFSEEKRIVPGGMCIRDTHKLAEKLASLDKNVIVSSENLSFIFNKTEIDALFSALSGVFSTIKIICYIRRQDLHAISHHQEGAKLWRAPEYDLFGYSPRALPEYESKHDLYLNYYNRLSMWADVFGNNNMIIKIFDRKLLKKEDVVADFLQLFDIDNYRAVDEKNVSMDFYQSKLGHLANKILADNNEELYRCIVPGNSNAQKALPSRQEAFDYYQRFRQSNILLNERFKISANEAVFNEEFDMYPEVASDQWDEASANEAIAYVINGIKKLRKSDEFNKRVNADILRVAALALEKTDINLSYKLMSLAHQFRPHGPIIKQKLRQYKEALKSDSKQLL